MHMSNLYDSIKSFLPQPPILLEGVCMPILACTNAQPLSHTDMHTHTHTHTHSLVLMDAHRLYYVFLVHEVAIICVYISDLLSISYEHPYTHTHTYTHTHHTHSLTPPREPIPPVGCRPVMSPRAHRSPPPLPLQPRPAPLTNR